MEKDRKRSRKIYKDIKKLKKLKKKKKFETTHTPRKMVPRATADKSGSYKL